MVGKGVVADMAGKAVMAGSTDVAGNADMALQG